MAVHCIIIIVTRTKSIAMTNANLFNKKQNFLHFLSEKK